MLSKGPCVRVSPTLLPRSFATTGKPNHSVAIGAALPHILFISPLRYFAKRTAVHSSVDYMEAKAFAR